MKKQTIIIIVLLAALVLTEVFCRLYVHGNIETAMHGDGVAVLPAYKHCRQVDWQGWGGAASFSCNGQWSMWH